MRERISSKAGPDSMSVTRAQRLANFASGTSGVGTGFVAAREPFGTILP